MVSNIRFEFNAFLLRLLVSFADFLAVEILETLALFRGFDCALYFALRIASSLLCSFISSGVMKLLFARRPLRLRNLDASLFRFKSASEEISPTETPAIISKKTYESQKNEKMSIEKKFLQFVKKIEIALRVLFPLPVVISEFETVKQC